MSAYPLGLLPNANVRQDMTA